MLNRLIGKLTQSDDALFQRPMSNGEFVSFCYREFLGRDVDAPSLQNAVRLLDQGLPRVTLLKGLVTSPEFLYGLLGHYFPKAALPNLRHEHPERYTMAPVVNDPNPCLAFRAEQPADYDWIEAMILEHGYYDTLGIWNLVVDTDKHILAEIIGRFAPKCSLELGCSTGSVLKLLDDQGIVGEGIDISHLALALAPSAIRRRIHFGDILTLPLEPKYDLLIGMDVFEHLNPNKMPAVARRCFELVRDGGFLFTNIPVFGADPVFGDLYPAYLEPWQAELARGVPFSLLHVDDAGWPLQGHLIWAPSSWWQALFEAAGFRREERVERALHQVYDDYFAAHSPGRRSFYVFSKHAQDPAAAEQLAARIVASGSEYAR